MRIQEETAWKDRKIYELEDQVNSQIKSLEYYKTEYHQMEALVGVMENRTISMQLRDPEGLNKSNTDNSFRDQQVSENEGNRIDNHMERWIPPTGFIG